MPTNRILVALAAAFSLALTVVAWRAAERQERDEAGVRFEFRVDEVAQSLAGRMLDYEQVLRGAAGLLAASGGVDAAAWKRYVETLRLQSSYPGIQALAYAPYLRDGPAAAAPVRFIEPLAHGNERVVGFDMLTEPQRRSAIERARDTGEAVLTGRLTLRSEADGTADPAFLMYVPVYGLGEAPAALEERRARFAAVVYAAFRAGDLFQGAIGRPSGMHLRLVDASDPAAPQLLYDDGKDVREPRYVKGQALAVLGRSWRLEASSRPSFEGQVSGDRPRLVLSAGIALAFLFTALAWSLVNTLSQARELARRMTAASEERDRFRFAVERHWDTMLMADAERLRILYANEGACRNLGYRREELVGQPAAMVFADRDAQRLAAEYRQLADGDLPGEVERASFRRKDGSTFPVEVSRQVLKTAAGTFVLGVARDITARLEAERSIRESEARLALSLESSGLALFDWDLRNNLVHLGKEWQALLGGEPRASVTPIQKLEQLVHPDDLPALREQVRRLLAGELESYRVEHRVRTLDGQWKWIESAAKVSGRDVAGRATRVTGTNADISERKALGELKDAFIANVSHELRTPLTSIVASLDILREEIAGELSLDRRKFLDIAYDNSGRLAELINDILDLERIESGRLRLSIEEISVDALLARTAKLNAAYAERYKARLTSRAEEPGLRVMADEDRLLQVLTNLVSNAAKHSPPGGEIALRAARRENRIRFSVSDQGAGVPDAFKQRLFGKFEQADASKPGTGLGLAISKAMSEKMGGSIGFRNEPGGGATFYVELPLAQR